MSSDLEPTVPAGTAPQPAPAASGAIDQPFAQTSSGPEVSASTPAAGQQWPGTVSLAVATPETGILPLSSTADETVSTDNSASTLIEAPLTQAEVQAGTVKRHEFSDGGGSGGAEAFRRRD